MVGASSRRKVQKKVGSVVVVSVGDVATPDEGTRAVGAGLGGPVADVGASGLGLATAPAFHDEAVGWLDRESNLVSVDKDLLVDVLPVDVWERGVDWPSAAAATRFVVCHGGYCFVVAMMLQMCGCCIWIQ
jgi:hypothetical protein